MRRRRSADDVVRWGTRYMNAGVSVAQIARSGSVRTNQIALHIVVVSA